MDSLTDLGPALAVVFGPLLALVAVMMRYQHVDSTKTRDLINESSRQNRELINESSRQNRDLIEKSSRENRDLIRENRELIRENRELIEKNHREVTGSLGDVRERLAHIEGFLKSWPTPPPAGDAKAA